MNRKRLNIIENISISHLKPQPKSSTPQPTYADWIRILRTSLRMSQAELAKRVGIPQSHIASIETGKTDPQLTTMRRIFNALSCDLVIEPRPAKLIPDLLRDRARALALRRLKQSMGTMALENQAPDAEIFRSLLEKRTDEIINDKRERLWREENA